MRKDVCWPIWIIGLLGYLILAWWAIRISTLGQDSIPAKLDWAAQASLDRAGIPWARVQIDGQAAILSGSAPSKAARNLAKSVVKTSIGPGGLFMGGVTAVRDRTAPNPTPAATLRWRAKRGDNGLVTLSGSAPSIAERSQLMDAARAYFKGAAFDDMSADKNGPQTGWTGPARLGLELVAQMPDGEAELLGQRLIVRGTAPNQAFADSALSRLKALPKPFTGESAIVTKIAIPELGGADLAATGSSSSDCQSAFTKIMASNSINFESGGEALKSDNKELLDKIAYVAKRCSQFRIDVAGHTDSSGTRAENLRLSKARAAAVVTYLVGQGIAPERLSSMGAGPDRPVASNDTPAGMAKNRRIGFTVRDGGAQ